MRASDALDRGLADIIKHSGNVTKFLGAALDMLEVDLVALATSYVGEHVRGSIHGVWSDDLQVTLGGNAVCGEIEVTS